MDIFALRLKEARALAGLTQKQLAQLINSTDDSIYSWEKGRSQPNMEMLRLLCKVLNVSSDYLIGLSNNP